MTTATATIVAALQDGRSARRRVGLRHDVKKGVATIASPVIAARVTWIAVARARMIVAPAMPSPATGNLTIRSPKIVNLATAKTAIRNLMAIAAARNTRSTTALVRCSSAWA
ncbi:MAG: hypothetical protein JSS27_10455 [Planctomycetes bacterium]|nr:hypothetical protein [Planctomycetota bacterium]